jgi:hypothetical protein
MSNAEQPDPPKKQRTMQAAKSDSPLDPKSEQIMEQLLSLLQTFTFMGLLHEAGPHIHELMGLVYFHARHN